MAKWTQASREAYYKDHPNNFAGENMSFPIKDGSDVNDAWRLAGHAENPDAVRAKIKSIAKRLGLESSLPDTAKEDEKERSMGANHIHEALTRATTANHEPMTGTHSHPHPAHDSQGDDATHEHSHTHDGDNNHDHMHAEDRALTVPTVIQASNRHVMSLPLVRIDSTKREVWGQATAEVPDSYGTIFGYYPDAWKSWRGNIREQHDPKKAVGKRFELECDDMNRAIHVGSRISRGAQDTWLKVEDNVLTGYSASIIPDPEFGPDPARWPKKEYNGKQYPYLPRYTVAELSLVDNPACPGCNIQIVRADGFATDVLDTEEEETQKEDTPLSSPEHLERAGARVSSSTRDTMHSSIAHTLRAAHAQMGNCGCENCTAAMKMIDPDEDGDIDMGGYDDPDGDWQSLYGNDDENTERLLSSRIERVLEQKLTPIYARLQGIAGQFARSNATTNFESLITSAITRAVETVATQQQSSLDEVRASLETVKGQVERIAETPVPGAPIMNASALPKPVEKRLPTDPYAAPRSSGSAVADALRQLAASGQLETQEQQTDAIAAALLMQRQGR